MILRPHSALRRTPQTSNSSPSSPTPTPAVATTTKSANPTSWDSAHWEVGTLPSNSATAAHPDSSKGNGSLLSNTGAFAGIIVGITIFCLVIVGFLVYQVKYRKPKPHTLSQNSTHFSQLASSTTTGPIKLPPSPYFPDHTSSRPSHLVSSRSRAASSTRQSSRRTVNPVVASSGNDSACSRPPFTPPDTPSDRNEFELSQRSEQTSLSHRNIRSPFDTLSSRSSGLISYHGREARASAGAASSATSQATSAPRPLPFPPHSPPPYSPKHASLQRPPSQNSSSTPPPLSNAFRPEDLQYPGDEKHRSLFTSDGIPRVSQPPPFGGEYPIRYTVPSTDDDPSTEGLPAPFRDPHKATLSNTLAVPTASTLRDSMMSSTSTAVEHGNAPPSSWRSPVSPLPPRPMSANSDPFNNRGFELPSWLHSDPYSRLGQSTRGTASIYSVAQRSVAASSKILPSDTSLRTLTPEPSEDDHGSTLHVAVLTRFRPTSMGQGTDAGRTIDGESVEGDGPDSNEVQVFDGPERRGWGTEDGQQQSGHGLQRTTSTGSIARARPLHLDHFSPETMHPPLDSSSSTNTSFGVPLSAGFEARGLGRSFTRSLGSKTRRPSTAPNENSLLPPIPQEATFSPEDMPAWLSEDPYERRRASIGAASSKLLPSEGGHGDASSIRSVSPEVGWIESRRESVNIQSPSIPIPQSVDEHRVLDISPSFIDKELRLSTLLETQESSQPQSQPRPLPSTPVPPPL